MSGTVTRIQKEENSVLQRKLKLGQVNKKYGIEVDTVTDQVKMKPTFSVAGHPLTGNHDVPVIHMSSLSESPELQMECEECEDEEQIQMKPGTHPLMMANADDEEDENSAIIPIQPKLQIGEPGDKYEQEADSVADRVMKMNNPDAMQMQSIEEEEESLQMKSAIQKSPDGNRYASNDISKKLNSTKGSGEKLPKKVGTEMGSKMGADFSATKIHTDSQAINMNKELGAQAFTHGSEIYFNQRKYDPGSSKGKLLLAHELTHVIQQSGTENTVKKVVQRKMELPKAKRSSSFIPLGIIGEGNIKRLSIIIRSKDTLNKIAEKLLPIWNNAPPIKSQPKLPPTQITKEQLAKALLINNQNYLAIPPNLSVPQMTNWKVGLRFPLPVWVNRITGDSIVNPYQIATQAKHFNPKWTTFLSQKPKILNKLSPQEMEKSVTALISSEKSNYYRGFSLAYKSLKNAAEYLPIIEETLGKVGSGKFELALGFMNALVNFQFDLLTNQIPGLGILELIKKALANPPDKLSPDRNAELIRAKKMLARLGVYSIKVAEVFKETYVSQRWGRAGMKCMHAFYRGLGALYGKPFSKALGELVRKEAGAFQKRTKINTNNVTRIMETLRSKGKAGPQVVMKYKGGTKTWDPDPETTILGMINNTVAGWYFFGFSLHGAYHSVILAVDNTDITSPKIYWMDQHEKGFTKNVTGRLVAEMKSWKPSYGFAHTKLWQMIPDADTLVRLD